MKVKKRLRRIYDRLYFYGIPIRVRPVLLNQLERAVPGRYLISSTRGLYLLQLGSIYRLLKGNYYGITIHDDKIFVYENVGFRGRLIQLVFDNNFRIQTEGVVWKSDLSPGCHQIDCVEDRLFVTDTYNNRILCYNVSICALKEYYPLGRLSNGRESENYGHINSIFKPPDSDYFYLFCHNETTKTNRKSEINIVDEAFQKISVIEIDSVNGHNVAKFRDKLFYCDSDRMTLVCDNKVVFKARHLTRGLSITDRFILVGGSEFANRENRNKSTGYLYILSHDFRLYTAVNFPGPVQEIRKLDGIDYGMSNRRSVTIQEPYCLV